MSTDALKGRITELVGDARSFVLPLVNQAQAQDNFAAWVDCPHKLDLKVAKEAGVNLARMLLSQPDDPDHACDLVEALLRSQQLGLVVLDSPPRWDSRTWRKLLALAEQTETALVCLTDGNDRVLRFYTSAVVELRGSEVSVLKNKYTPKQVCESLGAQESHV